MQVLILGSGVIGTTVAYYLAKAGHEVRAFDLSEEALSAAVDKGCKRAGSTDEAVKGADAVVTMLPAGKHVAEVYRSHVFGVAAKTAILIDCSTIDVATAKTLEEEAAAQGYTMVDAPVSGGQIGAEQATLAIMVGGGEPAFQRALPVFQTLGRNITHVGGAGAGQVAKLANQLIVGVTIGAVAEAIA